MTDIVDRILALAPERQADFARRMPPLSIQQEQLWLHQQIEPDSALYNVQTTLRARGPLDPELLRAATVATIERNAVLRTSLVEIDGRPCQIIREQPRVDWTHQDLADQAEPVAAALQAVRSALQRPFDLARDACLRVLVLKIGLDDHIVAVIAHHVTLDATGVRLLLNQLAGAYVRLGPGRDAAIQPDAPSLQYADYAGWQYGTNAEIQQADLRWWQRALSDFPAPLDVPTDHARTGQRGPGARVSRLVPAELVAALDDVRRRAGATRFMVFIAAWAELLGRYGAARTICIGTPVSGRTKSELELLIGNFVSDVPLLIQNTPQANFAERLAHVREVVTGAFAHQSAPLSRIAEAVGQRPGELYQTLVNMVIIPPGAASGQVAMNDVILSQVDEVAPPGAMNDLSLVIHDLPEGLWVHVDYDTALFGADTIDQKLGYYFRLLESCSNQPDLPLRQVSMASSAERAAVESFGGGERIAVPGDSVHALFSRQARRTPEAIALAAGDTTMTYAALEGRSNALAALLCAQGIGAEDQVFTALPESIDVVVAWLAIMKAGAAFVPLDCEAPAQRNRELMAQAGGSLVLTGRDWAAASGLEDHQWLDVVAFGETLPDFAARPVLPDNPIYVMFTSGSTGLPKGVVVTQRGIMNRLAWMSHHFPHDCAQRVLKTTRHLFDSAIWQIFWPLSLGGTAIIIDAAFPGGIGPVLDTIRRHGVTAVDFVPSTFSAMVEELARGSDDSALSLPSLRLAVFGGEQVTRDGVDWFHRHSAAQVYNLYGPTEASIGCIYRPLSRDYGGFIPIGKPIGNTDVLLLDADGQPVPVGIQGEICLVGECLARGYLGQAAVTAAAFTPAPDGKRLYRTGDLGRWTGQGDLVFIGRRDHQVKIRGFRIELGEIETALAQCPGVARAVVIADGKGTAAKRLYAFVVPGSGEVVDPRGVRQFLQTRLADHLIPAQVVVLEALPLLPNGKLDRRSLLIPETGPDLDDYEPPLAGIESVLAEVFCDVLGIQKIGRNDNYFDLGGDSIQAIRIASRARAAGILLPASKIFIGQTIAEMAALAGTIDDAAGEESEESDGGPFALTPIQQRYLERASAGGKMCHTVVLKCDQDVTAEALSCALAAVIERHPALTLRLGRNGAGQWTQSFTDPPASFEPVCSLTDLANLNSDQRLAELRTQVEQLRASLDMTEGPTLQSALFDLGPEGLRLVIVVHHLCIDALSWPILIGDLELALSQQLAGTEIRLPRASASFQTYAERLVQLAAAPRLASAVRWWTDREWSQLPPAASPTDPVRPQEPALHSIVLAPDVYRPLFDGARARFGIQAGEALLGCIAAALAEAFDQPCVAIALEGHGRDLIDDLALDRTIGWFTNYYPVQFDLSEASSIEPALCAVADQLRAVPDKGLPFGLGRYTKGEPALAGIPEPQVSFNYLGQLDQREERTGRLQLVTDLAGWKNLDDPIAGRLIDINASVTGDQLGIHLVWSRHGLAEGVAADLIARIEGNIRRAGQLCADPAPTATQDAGFDFLSVV